MKKFLSIALCLVLILALLTGCGGNSGGSSSGGSSSGGDSAKKTTFTVGLQGDPVSLDPAFAYDWICNPIVNQVSETLLTFDENNEIVPLLCESWEATDDVTYVYNVRSDVTWSNGEPMTMEDVMFSVNRTADPDFGSYLQWMYSPVESIEQTGDWQFTVKLSAPNANWQYTFATTGGSIVNKAQCEELGEAFGTAQGLPMGTGAYEYDNWSMGQEVVLNRCENYWDADNHALEMEKIVYKLIGEDTTRVTGCLNEEIDFAVYTPSDMVDKITSTDFLTVDEVESFGVCYVAFNCQEGPFSDPKVRQAAAYAIDLAALQENIIKSAGTPGKVMPNSMALCVIGQDKFQSFIDSANNYDYDVDKAKELLAEAGYGDGFSARLILNEVSVRYDIALAIQNYLAEIGIDVTVDQLTDEEHTNQQTGMVLDENGHRLYDMVIGGWEADYPDINGNFEPEYANYNSYQGYNCADYDNEEVTELCVQCNSSLDPDERVDLLIKAMGIANEELPYYNLFYPVRQMTRNTHFGGFIINESWVWNLYFKDCVYTE